MVVQFMHLHVSMSDLRHAPVQVRHSRSGLPRLLEEGAQIVVSDQDGEFHDAKVLWVDPSGDDPVYHLHVGVRLPMELASQRMSGADELPENRSMHQLLDLLGELSQESRRPLG